MTPATKHSLKPTFLLGHVLESIRIASTGETRNIKPSFEYKLCKVLNIIKKWLDDTSPLALDVEAESLARIKNKLALVQLSRGNGKTIVIPFFHPEWIEEFGEENVKIFTKKLLKLFKYWLENGTGLIIGANVKFDMIQLCVATDATWSTHPLWDIQSGELVIDENRIYRKWDNRQMSARSTLDRVFQVSA